MFYFLVLLVIASSAHAGNLTASNTKIYGDKDTGNFTLTWKATKDVKETSYNISIHDNNTNVIASGDNNQLILSPYATKRANISLQQYPDKGEFSIVIKNLKYVDDGFYHAVVKFIDATSSVLSIKQAAIEATVTAPIELIEPLQKNFYFDVGEHGLVKFGIRVKPTGPLTLQAGVAHTKIPNVDEIIKSSMVSGIDTVEITYQLPAMKFEYCGMTLSCGVNAWNGAVVNAHFSIYSKYTPSAVNVSTIKVTPQGVFKNMSIFVLWEPITIAPKVPGCYANYAIQFANKDDEIKVNTTSKHSQVEVTFANDYDRKNITKVRVQANYAGKFSAFSAWMNISHTPSTAAPKTTTVKTVTPSSGALMLMINAFIWLFTFYAVLKVTK